MHFELRKGKVSLHSLKEFASEYLMIVVGILTALSLEQVEQSVHRAHVVSETRERLDTEIRLNGEHLRESYRANAERLKTLKRISQVLQQDLTAKMPDDAIIKHVSEEAKQDLPLGISEPVSRHDEWDVALASQAASWMEPSDLRRYSNAYAKLALVPNAVREVSASWLNGARMIDVASDMKTNSASPRDLYRTINQVIAVNQVADEVMGDAISELDKSFPTEKKGR